MKTTKTSEAITRLAELFEYGVLMADTDPVEFLGMVTDEVKRLRKERDEARGNIKRLLGWIAKQPCERPEGFELSTAGEDCGQCWTCSARQENKT